jgi:hypothetical protein
MPTNSGPFISNLSAKSLRLVSPDGRINTYISINNKGNMVYGSFNPDRSVVPELLHNGWVGTVPSQQTAFYSGLQMEFDGSIGLDPTPIITSIPATTIDTISIISSAGTTNNNIIQFNWNTASATSLCKLFFTIASSDQGKIQTKWMEIALDNLPDNISGLLGWYDASYTSSIVEDSANIMEWHDRNGSNATLIQNANTFNPLWNIAYQNGLNTIIFDGSNDFVTGPLTASLTSCTFIILLKGTGGVPVSIGSTGIIYGPDVLKSYVNSTTSTSTLSITPNQWQICAFTWNKSKLPGINVDFYLDREIDTEYLGSTITVSETDLYVGNFNGNTGYSFNGNIAEIIIFNREINENEYLNVCNYLKNKWSV